MLTFFTSLRTKGFGSGAPSPVQPSHYRLQAEALHLRKNSKIRRTTAASSGTTTRSTWLRSGRPCASLAGVDIDVPIAEHPATDNVAAPELRSGGTVVALTRLFAVAFIDHAHYCTGQLLGPVLRHQAWTRARIPRGQSRLGRVALSGSSSPSFRGRASLLADDHNRERGVSGSLHRGKKRLQPWSLFAKLRARDSIVHVDVLVAHGPALRRGGNVRAVSTWPTTDLAPSARPISSVLLRA